MPVTPSRFPRLALGALMSVTLAASIGCGQNPTTTTSLTVQDVERMGAKAIPGELIVKVKPSVTSQSIMMPGAKIVDTLDLGSGGKFHLVRTSKNVDVTAKAFQAKAGVELTQPNYEVKLNIQPADRSPMPRMVGAMSTNDPLYAQQWYMPHINVAEAWKQSTGKGVLVAVCDTGIDYKHPDLVGAINGPDFINNDNDSMDEFGHGTHCAGIIGANANNGEGVAGVAPDAQLMGIEVLGPSGGGSLYTIAKGIKYAADYGKQKGMRTVINLSLGGPAIVDAVSYTTGWYATNQGALLVAAAGNSNTAVGTPARWNKYYMAVAASDENNEKAKFSCFGPELSVISPGVKIMNTTPSYDVPMNKFGYAKYYAPLQGTSMATPVVAGVAALVWSKHPDWTWKQVRQAIEKSALDLGTKGHDNTFGFGLVQAFGAVSR